ncbi:MAG: MBL fold metallo-hydrolase [Rhodospirillales bacterium]|nr:MBL fold metallo-hydrolase [Rhodospirillales bacterium]MDE2199821.1 MBL fold metallo-hydrolase [Rhodospirillales bacterium]MDE2575392.1 MBL fold metallo-hydrolase [Rhodospirillales bacterium]
MRVTLLGTGGSAGVPMIGGPDGRGDWGACDPDEPRNRRTRTSIAVEAGQGALLVDTPPDLRAQLINCGISRIEAILYTHAHADHITGIDDVRILNRIIDRPLDAFATEWTLTELKRRFDYVFKPVDHVGFFRPVLVPRPIAPGQTLTIAGMEVQLFDQDHGFSRTLGLRIDGFGYSTDAVDLDDAAFATLRGVDTWVVGCFQREPHRTHAWLDRVLGWVERLRPRRTVLTHMGTDMDWSWLIGQLPPGIEPGHDGQLLTLD